ncbi:MAG TPA: hypothetical protein DDW73_02010 [Rhizobium sp.]|nr:hypothetical protein [Rhizobium sp.]
MAASPMTRRTLMKGSSMMALTYGASPKMLMADMAQKADAVVSKTGSHQNADEGHAARPYSTLEEALDAAPEASARPWVIALGPGDYREKLTVTKPNIVLVGSGKDTTRIVFDAFAGQHKPVSSSGGSGQWAPRVRPPSQSRRQTSQRDISPSPMTLIFSTMTAGIPTAQTGLVPVRPWLFSSVAAQTAASSMMSCSAAIRTHCLSMLDAACFATAA